MEEVGRGCRDGVLAGVWMGPLQQEGLERELRRNYLSFPLHHRVTQLVVSKPPVTMPLGVHRLVHSATHRQVV